MFTIELHERANDDLEGFSGADQRALVQKMREQLTHHPFPHGKTILS